MLEIGKKIFTFSCFVEVSKLVKTRSLELITKKSPHQYIQIINENSAEYSVFFPKINDSGKNSFFRLLSTLPSFLPRKNVSGIKKTNLQETSFVKLVSH
jgi:hypothetical protein